MIQRTILWKGCFHRDIRISYFKKEPMFRKKDRKGFFVDLDLRAIPDTTGISEPINSLKG